MTINIIKLLIIQVISKSLSSYKFSVLSLQKGWDFMKRKIRIFVVVFLLFVLQPLENVFASETEITKEEYESIIRETVALAEFFRSDEAFIYDANSCLTKEQTTYLKEELLPLIYGTDATTEKEQVEAVLSYVRSNMKRADGQAEVSCENTYEMLCGYPTENNGELFVGDCYSYTLAVRDLCALSGIPAILLGDESTMSRNYQIVMVYVDSKWQFLDVFKDSSSLVEAEEMYESMEKYFLPTKVNFGYTGGNSMIGYAGSIYINSNTLELEGDAGRTNSEFNLMFDKEKEAVLQMLSPMTPMTNSGYYGANEKTDEDGKVPTGFLSATIMNAGANGEWRFNQAYSQYGVLLQGYVSLDGVEHDFSQFGSYGSLHYYEIIEEREPTKEEQEKVNQFRLNRLALCAKIGEALLADSSYEVFLDYTEEELAYLKAAAAEAVTKEWVMRFEENPDEELLESEYTDYQKAQGIINYIKTKVPEYVYSFGGDDSYSVLISGKATCQNYAFLLTELCALQNIPCFTLSGQLGTTKSLAGEISDHAANLLKLDGEWYISDPTNGYGIIKTDKLTNFNPVSFLYSVYDSSERVYISHEMMLRDLSYVRKGLCYGFDSNDKYGIYFMNRSLGIATYTCELFETDTNGKLKQNNGFITWEEKEKTEIGYEIREYEGYVRQGYTIGGNQIINGKAYSFPRIKESAYHTGPTGVLVRLIGYLKEIKSCQYDINKMSWESVSANYIYTGDNIEPKPVIKNGDTILIEGQDYTLSYQNHKNISTDATGKAYMIVDGINSYYSSFPIYFEILPKEITEADVTFSQEKFVWNMDVDKAGGFTAPQVTVNAPKTDCTISFSGFSGIKQGTVVVQGRYNCTGRVERVFDLEPMSVENGEFTVSIDDSKEFVYRKAKWEPAVTVTWHKEDGTVYRELSSEEYDVTYENNLGVGTAKVTVEGNEHFIGKLETSFEIVKRDLSNDNLLKEALERTNWVAYTGEPIIPKIPGINDSMELYNTGYTLDEDFTMTISNNTNAGKGLITLEGIGNYTGTLIHEFTIKPLEIANKVPYIQNNFVESNGQLQLPQVIIDNLVQGEDFTATCYKRVYDETGETYEYEEATPIEAGSYWVLVELTSPNYCFLWEEKTRWLNFVINEKTNTSNPGSTQGGTQTPIISPDLGVSGDKETENGNIGTETDKETNIQEDTTVGGGNTVNGNTGTGNNGSGAVNQGNAKEDSKDVVVSKVKKLKVKKKKKDLLIQWKKTAHIDGYQLQISTNKKYKKAKKVTLGRKKTSYKFKKYKKGKTYYVRIRAYQMIENEDGTSTKVFGKWVSVKKKA